MPYENFKLSFKWYHTLWTDVKWYAHVRTMSNDTRMRLKMKDNEYIFTYSFIFSKQNGQETEHRPQMEISCNQFFGF